MKKTVDFTGRGLVDLGFVEERTRDGIEEVRLTEEGRLLMSYVITYHALSAAQRQILNELLPPDITVIPVGDDNS